MQDIQHQNLILTNHTPGAAAQGPEYYLSDKNAGAFFDSRIRDQSRMMSLKSDLQLLQARVDAHSLAVMELFCLLVENAPEVLPAEWSTVADVLASEERLWVYPAATGHRMRPLVSILLMSSTI